MICPFRRSRGQTTIASQEHPVRLEFVGRINDPVTAGLVQPVASPVLEANIPPVSPCAGAVDRPDPRGQDHLRPDVRVPDAFLPEPGSLVRLSVDEKQSFVFSAD